MKVVFYTSSHEVISEMKVEPLYDLDGKYIVDDVQEILSDEAKILDEIGYEVYIYAPYNGGEDFYLKYANNGLYENEGNYTFVPGGLITKTLIRDDTEGTILKIIQRVYETGQDEHYLIVSYNDMGNFIKSLDATYSKINDNIVMLFEDKTEVRVLRENILHNETDGVAIYQDNKFVRVNDRYLNLVGKTRENLLYHEMDLTGVKPEVIAFLHKGMENIITRQQNYSNKYPVESIVDGKVKFYFNTEASYTMYMNKPAILITLRDLTQLQRVKRSYQKNNADLTLKNRIDNIETYNETFTIYKDDTNDAIFTETLYDVIEDVNREYKVDDYFRDLILEDDLDYYNKMLSSITPDNPEVKFTIRILTLKNNIKYIRNFIIAQFDDGNMVKFISAHQNITGEKIYTNQLRNSIIKKSEEIEDKNILIKEVHHRVKNNLQIILSLMGINEHFNKDNPFKIVKDAKNYIKTIAAMHEKIYNSTTLSTVNLKDYLDTITNSLLKMYSSQIAYISEIQDITLDINQAIPLGLIVNELINNTIKYAFPDGEEGTITINIGRIDKYIEVEYRDDGVGFPEDTDFNNPSSLGLLVINNLSNQINGVATYSNKNGSCTNIVFKETESDTFVV